MTGVPNNRNHHNPHNIIIILPFIYGLTIFLIYMWIVYVQ